MEDWLHPNYNNPEYKRPWYSPTALISSSTIVCKVKTRHKTFLGSGGQRRVLLKFFFYNTTETTRGYFWAQNRHTKKQHKTWKKGGYYNIKYCYKARWCSSVFDIGRWETKSTTSADTHGWTTLNKIINLEG